MVVGLWGNACNSSLQAEGSQVPNQLVLQNETLLEELKASLGGEGPGPECVHTLFPGSGYSHHSSEGKPLILTALHLGWLVQFSPSPLGRTFTNKHSRSTAGRESHQVEGTVRGSSGELPCRAFLLSPFTSSYWSECVISSLFESQT